MDNSKDSAARFGRIVGIALFGMYCCVAGLAAASMPAAPSIETAQVD